MSRNYIRERLKKCNLENGLDKICPPKASKLDNLEKEVEKATLPQPVRVNDSALIWVSV